MKKLLILLVSLVASSVVFAHGSGWTVPTTDNESGYWKRMDNMHNLVHDTRLSTSNTNDGIKIVIVGASENATAAIEDELLNSKDDLIKYFQDVSVKINARDSGIELIFSSEDEKVVGKLQSYGPGLVYRFLQDRVHQEEGLDGHMGYRQGMKGDSWGHMMGNGPTMMYGNSSNYDGYFGHMR